MQNKPSNFNIELSRPNNSLALYNPISYMQTYMYYLHFLACDVGYTALL